MNEFERAIAKAIVRKTAREIDGADKAKSDADGIKGLLVLVGSLALMAYIAVKLFG